MPDPPQELPRPFLTAHIPPVRGTVRERPEDFEVDEILAYEPSGEGEHLFITVLKRGIATLEAVRRIASRLGLAPFEVGYAGLKDARAVARQVFSVPAVRAKDPRAIEDGALRVVETRLHGSKLRVGHARANRFRVRLGGAAADEGSLRAAVELLSRSGVPNFFGRQRLGAGSRTARAGRAVLRGEAESLVEILLREDAPGETGRLAEARALAREGKFREAARVFPRSYEAEQRAASALARRGDARAALDAIPRHHRQFYVNAYQSDLFNRLLAERMPHIDRVVRGDVAFIHEKGAAFLVDDPEREAPRVASFEISPSGPLFGFHSLLAEGDPGERERALIASEGCDLSLFRAPSLSCRGARRPYRVPLGEASVAVDGADLVVAFVLPGGAYATTVLSEIRKEDVG